MSTASTMRLHVLEWLTLDRAVSRPPQKLHYLPRRTSTCSPPHMLMFHAAGDGSSEPTAQQVIKVDMSNTQNVYVYAGADKACQNAMDGSPMFSDPESLVLGGLNFGPQSYCYVYSGSNPTYSGKSFMITSMNPGTMGAGTDSPYFYNMFTQSSVSSPDGSFCSGNSDCSSGMCTSSSGSACNNGRRLSTFRRLFGAPSSSGGCMICVSNSHAHRELNKGLQHHSKSSSPHGKATGSSAHHKG